MRVFPRARIAYANEQRVRVRGALGGDAACRGARRRRGAVLVRTIKPLSARVVKLKVANLLDPRCLIKGSREFDLLKSRVMLAVCDQQADPKWE